MAENDDKGAKAQVKPAYAPRGPSTPRPAATRMTGRPLQRPSASPARSDPEAGRPAQPAAGPAAPRRPAAALPEPATGVPTSPAHELAPPRHFDPRNGIMGFVSEYADQAATHAHVAGQYASIGDSRECLRSLKMFYAVAKQLVSQIDDLQNAIEAHGEDDIESFRYPMG